MPPRKKPVGKKKVAAGGHVLADPIPAGQIMTDCFKKPWRVGESIGKGGFGLIYLTDTGDKATVSKDAPYVMKVEPHENGPLLCEQVFYQRCCKPQLLADWSRLHSVKNLGVPKFISSGNMMRNGENLRFLVIQRLGGDLQKLFEASGRRFPEETVFTIGLKMMDALQYLHEHSYAHADIKAGNILLGYKKPQQLYLVDFGLAFKYVGTDGHKAYKEDPKWKHNGTIEFTSRDAHRGAVPSRRGDLEILGYCMVQWLCGRLPWERNLDDKDWVAAEKEKHMKSITAFMNACFPKGGYPAELKTYLDRIVKLGYDAVPSYNDYRQLFKAALKRLGTPSDGRLNFKPAGPEKASRAETSAVVKSPPAARPKKPRVSSPAQAKAPKAEKKAPGKVVKKSPTRRIEFSSGSDEEVLPAPEKRRTPKATKARAAVKSSVLSPRNVPAAPAAAAVVPAEAWITPAEQLKRRAAPGAEGHTRKAKRARVVVSSVQTQTSPGLRGLARSRKKRTDRL